ncbi:MAG: polysaccharide biosynthesis/export family protein [Dysgonomonas sp.]
MKQIIIFILFCLVITSCSQQKPNVAYFQNIDKYTNEQLESITTSHPTTIRPDDELTIIVSSVDPLAVKDFNLSNSASIMNRSVTGEAAKYTPQTTANANSYVVSQAGEINFPTLGKLKISGMTIDETVAYLESRLKEYVKDPIVNIQILNFRVSVIGEVLSPGAYYFSGQRTSVLDAIATAKDLTIYGNRNNVLLIRDNNGKKEYFRIDLTKSDFLSSPVFYLQQNDVIYVEPNEQKQRDSNMGSQRQYNLTLVTSIIGYTLTAISVSVSLIIGLNK